MASTRSPPLASGWCDGLAARPVLLVLVVDPSPLRSLPAPKRTAEDQDSADKQNHGGEVRRSRQPFSPTITLARDFNDAPAM